VEWQRGRRSGTPLAAILLDIDHSPEALLDERSSSFYRPDGLLEGIRAKREQVLAA